MTSSRWYRDPLFDSTRGELGLAWSLFKIRGTPTPETWPVCRFQFRAFILTKHHTLQDFDKLPDAGGVTFTLVPAVPLTPLLPHLPSAATQGDSREVGASGADTILHPTPLDLLSRFLVYPPEKRLKAADALSHPWFKANILLPEAFSTNAETQSGQNKQAMSDWEGKTLGQWIHFLLAGTEDAKG